LCGKSKRKQGGMEGKRTSKEREIERVGKKAD